MGSLPVNKTNVLITGAGGFIGQCLAAALMADPAVESLLLTDVAEPKVPSPPNGTTSPCVVKATAADLTQLHVCQSLITADLTHVYLLHGIMSGAAEANLDLGLSVNIDSMRHVLDTLRKVTPGIRVIFPSSLAVFGPTSDDVVVTEATMPQPQSSYGAQKYICETLLNESAD